MTPILTLICLSVFILFISIIAMAIVFDITKNNNLLMPTLIVVVSCFTALILSNQSSQTSTVKYQLALNSEGHTQYSTKSSDYSGTKYTFTTKNHKTVNAFDPDISYNRTNTSHLEVKTTQRSSNLFGIKFQIANDVSYHVDIIK